MTEITRQRVAEYYNYDAKTGNLTFKERPESDFKEPKSYRLHLSRVGKKAGCINSDGYVAVYVDRKFYTAHKIVWLLVYGEWISPKYQIDHINGDRSDNRIENLRVVTHSENARNAGINKKNTSGTKGVSWNKKHKRWVPNIRANGIRLYLGQFKTLEEAIIARRTAESKYGYEAIYRLAYRPQTSCMTGK